MVGALSFILIDRFRRVLALDVLNLGTAIKTSLAKIVCQLNKNRGLCQPDFLYLNNYSGTGGNFFLRASTTRGGTIRETSPLKEASSLMEEDLSTIYLGSVVIKRVSISG